MTPPTLTAGRNWRRSLSRAQPSRLEWFVGIEDTCVYPRAGDSFAALDEHLLTGHDARWKNDVDQIAGLGVDGLRYGMSWPVVHIAPGRFDWRRLDPVLERMGDLGLHVIADLVHYGCPPWLLGSFVDDGFVPAITEFALALLDRYGSTIGSITPINEPLTTASFCGLRKVWPPALGSWNGWAAVAVSVIEACQSVTHATRELSPDTFIVHVEAAHLFETTDPELELQVALLSRLGDLPTDLLLGRVVSGDQNWEWLCRHGIDENRLARLQTHAAAPDVLGVNYYPDLTPRVLARRSGEVVQMAVDRWSAGLGCVLQRTYDRYAMPMIVSETSIEGSPERRGSWMTAAVAELHELRSGGVDVRGLTWWPLIDFVDWSYIDNGTSVEEFVNAAVDPVLRELVPVSIDDRDPGGGLDVLARRMGLWELGVNGAGEVTHTPTAAATQFEELIREDPIAEPARLRIGGAPFSTDGTQLLDGVWRFEVNAKRRTIEVPGLWESFGELALDGTATYRTTFAVEDPNSHWTLRFGAVMDRAHVWCNGVDLGTHALPYTPFEIDVTGIVGPSNELTVEVTDPPVGSDEHLGSAHGKQGWANHEFPSPPSMYLTYGGIWQSVTLRQHGQFAIRDISCNLDPTNTIVEVEVQRISAQLPPTAHSSDGDRTQAVVVNVDLAGIRATGTTHLKIGETGTVTLALDCRHLTRWSPQHPVLHPAAVTVHSADGSISDSGQILVGLRTVAVDRRGLIVNGELTPIKSVLVQGFHADRLYAEGTVAEIEHEVASARTMGFNMLRLHLRAFAPAYLEVCERLGMLLHCDVAIGEPIRHDQIDAYGEVARSCEASLTAQVRRDRSHPSIVLWSCMNEIGIDRPSLRRTARYERFARRMTDALQRADPTRPFIENDWIEPDTKRVFTSPLATAHWYGHLDQAYLAGLEQRCADVARLDRPTVITELGDWGLPHPDIGSDKFYRHRDFYAAALNETWWPGTLEEFSVGTQDYQGVSDRLQIEVLRQSGATAGYCLTELTDVPWEFNGLLDIDRNIKPVAAQHVTVANRRLHPMLRLDRFGVAAGDHVGARASIVNDEANQRQLSVAVRLGDRSFSLGSIRIPAHSTMALGRVELPVGVSGGPGEITITAFDVERAETIASSYPYTAHTPPATTTTVSVMDSAADAMVRATPGLAVGDDSIERVMVVGEDAALGSVEAVRDHLDNGGTVLLLAHRTEHAHLYPVALDIVGIKANWGGTPFRYTTDDTVIRAFARRSILHVHDADIAPEDIVVPHDRNQVLMVGVGVFKPMPRPANGIVVGAFTAGPGIVAVCQYRLETAVMACETGAQAIFGDIASWATSLRRQR